MARYALNRWDGVSWAWNIEDTHDNLHAAREAAKGYIESHTAVSVDIYRQDEANGFICFNKNLAVERWKAKTVAVREDL